MTATQTAPKNLPTLHAERDPDYVYVVYIRAARDAVWAALTDGKTVRSWWAGTRMNSTFKPGAPLAFERNGKVDVRGEILDSDAPNRLAYTFHVEGPGPQHDEGPTIVECLLEQYEDTTRLTVTHSNLKKGGKVRGAISGGWPFVLSGLKSFLESGETLQRAPK
jgi:uncharacterized protein YndB with AHSA1/START domain